MTTHPALGVRSPRIISPQRQFWLVRFFGGFFRHAELARKGVDFDHLSDQHLRDLGFEPFAARDDWPPTAWRPGTAQRLGKSHPPGI